VTFYHWLGADAEPIADETPHEYRITDNPDGGFTAENIEADGFITIHPKITTPPSA
jgi:hypothetical protein